MDIAEQIRKHLPRNPTDTVPLIDHYCQFYQHLFSDVRNYEYFKYLHLGLISDIKRKSLPQISKVVDVSSQSLHHCLDAVAHGGNPQDRAASLSYLFTLV